jgi:signal transduction histidine kinase/CRP-like cAMP-binding protein
MDQDKQELSDALRANRLFSSVPDEYLDLILPHVKPLTFKEGEYVFRQGESDKKIYLIRRGRVGIFHPVEDDATISLIELDENDYFGEMELLDGLPRSADAKSVTPVELLAIPHKAIKKLVSDTAPIAINIMEQLSLHLRKMNIMLVERAEAGITGSRTQLDQMTRLIEAAKSVNSSLDLDTVLEIILDTAIQLTGADRGTLYLLDRNTNEIWSKLLHGEHVGEIRLPVGKGIAGHVAETGETVNIQNTYDHPHFNPEIDQRSGYHTDTMLCMPMRNNKGEIIGVIQLLNKSDGLFNEEDEHYIEALSAHASIALDNARLHREVVHNERLSAVGRMANTIIHDLKSPMNTIKAYTKMLQQEVQNPKATEIADEVIHQADRLINMIREILDYSRGVISLELNTVNVQDLIMTMFRFLDKDFKERNIIIDTDLQYTGEWRMDADKIIRVLFNIAGNAADAMKSGGAFTIRTAEENNRLKLELSDTGIGMSPEIKSKLFEPFFTHGKKYGTGLGMAIVKKIIDDHGGSIEVMSEEGVGTSFTILLPRG